MSYQLHFWQYLLAAFVMVQSTFMAITLYLHRDATHRSLDLHPVLRHVFRFWLWMSSGMLTSEWVAVHRKHHARCETADDPHSPVIHGLKKVLLEGRWMAWPGSGQGLLAVNVRLRTVYEFRERLNALWSGTHASEQ